MMQRQEEGQLAVHLRDVVGALVALEDERRALGVEAARAVADLEGEVAADESLRAVAEIAASLRDDVGAGLDASSALTDVASAILRASVAAVVAAGSRDDGKDGDGENPGDAGRAAIEACLGHAQSAAERLGRLRQILAREGEIDARARALKGPLAALPEAAELVDVALGARRASADTGRAELVSSLDVLAAAEQAAAADGQLAAIASNARALRAALTSGRDAAATGADLVRRVVGAAIRIARDREEQRRRIVALEHEIESRRSVAQGLSQMRRKAALVLGQVRRFERLSQQDQLASGALGSLEGACLEHGLITVMIGLRDLRIDREALDQALSELSSALGTLLSVVETRPEITDQLSPAWDDLHAVDSRASHSEWQAALGEVVGLREDRHGTLFIQPDALDALVLADSLEPWRQSLLERIEAKTDDILRATQRLETIDALLSRLVAEGGETAAAAGAVQGAVARFVGAALQVMSDCHERVKERLLDPRHGIAVVADRVAAFRHVEDLGPGATTEERRAAIDATLAEVRERFVRLATEGVAPDGARAAAASPGSRLADLVTAHQRLAANLARARRLREIALAHLPQSAEDAIEMASLLAAKGPEALPISDVPLRDRLGEALEALHHEREFLRLLDLPTGGDLPVLRAMGGERADRLLALSGASITLLFHLLEVVGAEFDTLTEADRPGHLAWIAELLDHSASDVAAHLALLDERLLALPSNAERLARHAVVFDAYHRWARSLSESDLALRLTPPHGEHLFSRFEEPLARLGTVVIERTRPEASSWQAAGALESVIELQGALLARLVTRPTFTDMASRITALRDRASALRDELVARAEREDPFARGGGGHLA